MQGIGTRYAIRNTRTHPYIPYAAEKTLSRSLGGRGGLDRTVRRLQGYPASREPAGSALWDAANRITTPAQSGGIFGCCVGDESVEVIFARDFSYQADCWGEIQSAAGSFCSECFSLFSSGLCVSVYWRRGKNLRSERNVWKIFRPCGNNSDMLFLFAKWNALVKCTSEMCLGDVNSRDELYLYSEFFLFEVKCNRGV